MLDGTKGYNYILFSLAKTGDAATCRKYFALMEKGGFTPTVETYALSSLSRISTSSSSSSPSIFLANKSNRFEYMMQAHVNAKEYAKVFQYEKDMHTRSLALSQAACRYILGAHSGLGDSRAADRVLR